MNILHAIILMGPAPKGQNPIVSFIPIILIIVVFYFFMLRPQMKKSKEAKAFREALKKGDKIITIGGIHGRIVEVGETTFTIEVESGTRLKIEKSAVAQDNGALLNEENKK